MDTEANTCRKEVVPKLVEARWGNAPHAKNKQRTFTDGPIVIVGGNVRRGCQKCADFIFRSQPNFPTAVVENKSKYKHAANAFACISTDSEWEPKVEKLGLCEALIQNAMIELAELFADHGDAVG